MNSRGSDLVRLFFDRYSYFRALGLVNLLITYLISIEKHFLSRPYLGVIVWLLFDNPNQSQNQNQDAFTTSS